jgi:hypothetical protein
VAGDTYIYKEIPESFIMMLESDLNYLKDHPDETRNPAFGSYALFQVYEEISRRGFYQVHIGKIKEELTLSSVPFFY